MKKLQKDSRKDKMDRIMKAFNKKAKVNMTPLPYGYGYSELDAPICPYCKKQMKNAYDSISKQISPYLWQCECMPNMRLSRG